MLVPHLRDLRILRRLPEVLQGFLVEVLGVYPCDLTRVQGLLSESLGQRVVEPLQSFLKVSASEHVEGACRLTRDLEV